MDVTEDMQMSIGEATEFYLGEDPTDPGLIPSYHCNLIYSCELRWYLGILMEKETKASIGNWLYYNKTVEHQDILLQESKDEMPSPSLSEGEVQYSDDHASDDGPLNYTKPGGVGNGGSGQKVQRWVRPEDRNSRIAGIRGRLSGNGFFKLFRLTLFRSFPSIRLCSDV